MAKALGSEIIDFYANGWPEGYYHDECEIDVEALNPTEKYDLSDFGYVCPEDGNGTEKAFSSVFLKWKKAQSTTTILVTVPKEQLAQAKEQIKALGYKI
jgi:hypothetical protein